MTVPSSNIFQRERRIGILKVDYLQPLEGIFERITKLFFKKKQKPQEVLNLKQLIIDRIKEYLIQEPYCEDSLWSWSSNRRIDLVYPELLFKNKQTGLQVLFGVSFQVISSENPEEIEEYRNIFMGGDIPCLLLPDNEVPASIDLKYKIESIFNNELSLLSIK